MKILILGCNGQLGRCLNDQLINKDYEVIYASRDQIDIANFKDTKSQILKLSPDLIINAAAYTAVDKAEEDQKTANLINHLAVKNIADICILQGCWLIHVSTDYVFDGNSKTPYKEDDKTNPQGIYGETKLKGELAIQASGCKYIILRTAWVFSEYSSNFLKAMLQLGSKTDELSIVGDQIGCPTYAQDIAIAITEIIKRLNSTENLQGIYHYCGKNVCSWFEFASKIFNSLSAFGINSPQKLRSIATSDYPTDAKRPAYSVLNCKSIYEKFDINQPNLDVAINSALKKIFTNKLQ